MMIRGVHLLQPSRVGPRGAARLLPSPSNPSLLRPLHLLLHDRPQLPSTASSWAPSTSAMASAPPSSMWLCTSTTPPPPSTSAQPSASVSSTTGLDESSDVPLWGDPSSGSAASRKFRLSQNFVDKYRDKRPPFGFNGLGELVYKRTYARPKPDGSSLEQWYETVQRVVNGTYNMQRAWIEHHQLGWNPWRAQRSAQEMYDRIFHMKFLPPGRGLWAMGSPITEDKQLFAALNNCAFVSTAGLKQDPSRPFCFLMDAAMLGVGVGFDTKGAGEVVIRGFSSKPGEPFLVPDSREGWVISLRMLLDAIILGKPQPVFDYSAIRPAGTPIKGFGGLASGPGTLLTLHQSILSTLQPHVGQPISVTNIVDIMNLIGKCVVSGNVRRTAEIAFGDPMDPAYVDLKNYELNPHRAEYGWTSNNSVFATLGMDYTDVVRRVCKNGEPGFAWLENMRAYSRMNGEPDHKDHRAAGGNPCLEQTLESYELCCLVETFPNNHESLDDFCRTLKFAYLYAKTVTLGKTHWPGTNRVMLRNRRIGCSMSGIAQFIASRGLHELQRWSEQGYNTIQTYDKRYSDWLAIPRSIKTTSIKPSGTVSILAGATPGIHHPESRFYVRRVRMPAGSELLEPLREAGYHIEPAAESANTVVVSFPVDVGKGVRTVEELSMWEQLSMAAFMQRHWADNQVSCTVSFNPETEGPQLKHALDVFQYQLKGVSFLPRTTHDYEQLPYEAITEQQFQEMASKLKPLNLDGGLQRNIPVQSPPDSYCDGDRCDLPSAAVENN